MPLIPCLTASKLIGDDEINALVDKAATMAKEKGIHIAEAEAIVKHEFINDEYGKLQKDLNDLKKKVYGGGAKVSKIQKVSLGDFTEAKNAYAEATKPKDNQDNAPNEQSQSKLTDNGSQEKEKSNAETEIGKGQDDQVVGKGAALGEAAPDLKDEPVVGLTKAWEQSHFDDLFKTTMSHDWGAVADRAWKDIQSGEIQPDKLEKEIVDKKNRPTSDEENFALLVHRREIQNLYKSVAEERDTAIKDGNEAGEMTAKQRLANILDMQEQNRMAIANAGTALGRGLNSLRMMMKEDYSLVNLLDQERTLRGRDLSDAETKEIQDLHQKITDSEAKYNALVEKHKQDLSDQADALRTEFEKRSFGKIQSDVRFEQRKARRKATSEELSDRKAKIVSDIKDKLREQRSRLSANPIPVEIFPDIAKLAKAHIEEGINTLDGVTDAVFKYLKDEIDGLTLRNVRDAITGYGKVATSKAPTEQSKILAALRSEGKYKSAIEDLEKSGKLPDQDKKVVPIASPDLVRARADAERAKNIWKQRQDEIRLKNRSVGQKILDAIVGWNRNIKLTSPITIARLFSSMSEGIVVKPVENLIGAGLSKLPIISQISKGAYREGGGFNMKAEAKAFTTGLLRSAENAYRQLPRIRGGKLVRGESKSDIDLAFGKGKYLPPEAAHFLGTLHSAVGRTIAQRMEFERSMVRRTTQKMANNINVNDPLVTAQTVVEALHDADRAVMIQDNLANSTYQNMIRGLEGSKDYPTAGKITAAVAKFFLPFVKIPTNIANETATLTLGLPASILRTGRAALSDAIRKAGSEKIANVVGKGISELTPDEKDVIMRGFKKGFIGAGLFALGFLKPNNYGGLYPIGQQQTGEQKTPWGTAKFGGVTIPQWMLANPMFLVMQLGATTRKVHDYYMSKGENQEAVASAVFTAITGMVGESPFLSEPVQFTDVFKSVRDRNYYLGSLAKNTVDPQIIQNIAQWTDTNNGKAISLNPKNQVHRSPQTKTLGQSVEQQTESGVPGLREKVPVKKATSTSTTTVSKPNKQSHKSTNYHETKHGK